MPQLNLFISYAHEDGAIANLISNLLQNTFGKALCKVFLDTEGIRIGADIKDSIKQALTSADVLILISTGVHRASHDWTGFELGFFLAMQQARQTEGKSPEPVLGGKVISVCLQGMAPKPTDRQKYIEIESNFALADIGSPEFENSIAIKEDDGFLLFFRDLLKATEGKDLDKHRAIKEDYIERLKVFKKELLLLLQGKVREIRKPQKQLLVRYNRAAVIRQQDLPGDAMVTSVGGAMGIFGVPQSNDPLFNRIVDPVTGVARIETTWATFCKAISDHSLGAYWRASLSAVVIAAGADHINLDNSQVIMSQTEGERYRFVLTTSTSFWNNEVEASLYLVSVLKRRDYGTHATTLLLKGLQLICRYRFIFLEPVSEFYYLNIRRIAIPELPKKMALLISELDALTSEALDAELALPGAWEEFVPIDHIEKMMVTWMPLESMLRKLCAECIDASGGDDAVSSKRDELIQHLKKIKEEIAEDNASLLKAISTKLMKLATSRLASNSPAPN